MKGTDLIILILFYTLLQESNANHSWLQSLNTEAPVFAIRQLAMSGQLIKFEIPVRKYDVRLLDAIKRMSYNSQLWATRMVFIYRNVFSQNICTILYAFYNETILFKKTEMTTPMFRFFFEIMYGIIKSLNMQLPKYSKTPAVAKLYLDFIALFLFPFKSFIAYSDNPEKYGDEFDGYPIEHVIIKYLIEINKLFDAARPVGAICH